MFGRLRQFDWRSGGGLGQSSSGQGVSNGIFHQGPGFGYLAANENTFWIESVYNHSESQPEVAGGGLNGANSARISGVGSCYEVANSKFAMGQFAGFLCHFGQISAKITSECCEVRYVRLPATAGAAEARRAGNVDRDVSEFAGHVVVTSDEFAVDYDADADAVGHTDVNEVMRGEGSSCARPHLGEGTGLCGVFNVDWKPCFGGQRTGNLYVSPAERGRVEDSAGLVVHDAWDDEADSLTAGFHAVNIDQTANPGGKVVYKQGG